MKIVFCVKRTYNVAGGAEWVLSEVANGLAERGHEVTVLSFDAEDRPSFYGFSTSVEHCRLGSLGLWPHEKVLDYLRMRRAAMSLRADIVVGFMPSIYVPLAFGFFATGTKFIACEHIVRSFYAGRPLAYLAICMAGNMTTSISFLSARIADEFSLIRNKQKIILANPVRQQSKKADVMGVSKGGYRILNVGRMVEFKDQRTLISAFAQIHTDFPNWRLRIIGQGELRSSLDRQIETLGISDLVSIQDSSSQIEEEYAAADLFVIPSIYEGFGLVTAEASCAGLPCLGFSDCEGTNQIIKDGVNGMLVHPGDDRVRSLAGALRSLMSDRQTLRFYARNGINLSTRYSLGKVLDEWEAVMLDVHAEH